MADLDIGMAVSRLGLEVSRLRLETGDLLIIRSETAMTPRQVHELRDHLRALPGVPLDVTVLVLPHDLTLERLAEWPLDVIETLAARLQVERERRGPT